MPGPPREGGRLLLLGASVRALADSAARSLEVLRRFPAGLLAIDYFGDTDLVAGTRRVEGARREASGRPIPEVTVVSVSRDLGLQRTTSSLGRAALRSEWSALAYAGGLENRPGLLRLLARRGGEGGRAASVLGNDGRTLAAVRDPRRLFPFLHAQGIPHAAARFDDRAPAWAPAAGLSSWLIKRVRAAGGAGVRIPRPGEPLPPGSFFQERLSGPIGSAAFIADGREAVLLGLTEQLAGWEALGASGFRYTGNIAGPPGEFLSAEEQDRLARAAGAIARHFGLRGLNGIDYVVQDGVPRLIEANPRWTASMELIEERLERNLFDLHLLALDGDLAGAGRLSGLYDPGVGASRRRFLAKGILYATVACLAPDPETLQALGARDRPLCGEHFTPGQPICTLIAEGDSPAGCRARLEEKAAEVRSRLRRP